MYETDLIRGQEGKGIGCREVKFFKVELVVVKDSHLKRLLDKISEV